MNTQNITPPETLPQEQRNPAHISAGREIIVGKIRIKVTSLFAGEQTLADKLFNIANRKLQGCIVGAVIAGALIALYILLLIMRLVL